jgi:hypothetical protein
MKRASYLGLIVLAVLLLALGGLLVRSTAAFATGSDRRHGGARFLLQR